jgi:putative addiction module component (TIGR02574 family)
MAHTKPVDYSQLSASERIQLAQELWDSVHEHAQHMPLTDVQRQELDRRWAAYQAGEMTASPWPEVKNRLLDS